MVLRYEWRAGLAVVRLVLAGAVLFFEVYRLGFSLTFVGAAFILYFLYAGFVFWWERKDLGASDLLRLLIDVVALLVCALNPPDRMGWVVSFFYVFVLASAGLLHQVRETCLVVAVMLLLAAATYQDQPVPIGPLLAPTGALAIVLAMHRRMVEKRMQNALEQSVYYRAEAENARELERQRIAADFHDGPLQSFISFQMRLEVIKKLLTRDQEAAVGDIVQLQEICRKQIADMRAFVRSMRMSADGATPATSIRQIAEDFQKTSGLSLSYNVGDAFSGLEPEVSHEVMQIVREALHNAQKHSKASQVTLSAEKMEGALQIVIEDNGAGFPFGGTYSLEELELMRMGPESIKRRVRSLSGELTLQSTPGRGSKIQVRVPL